MTASERKFKTLDALYRECDAENAVLYERFNNELAKVLNGVKAGQGVDELKRKLKEGQDEAGKLRRENARLRREKIGLRSLVKEAVEDCKIGYIV